MNKQITIAQFLRFVAFLWIVFGPMYIVLLLRPEPFILVQYDDSWYNPWTHFLFHEIFIMILWLMFLNIFFSGSAGLWKIVKHGPSKCYEYDFDLRAAKEELKKKHFGK